MSGQLAIGRGDLVTLQGVEGVHIVREVHAEGLRVRRLSEAGRDPPETFLAARESAQVHNASLAYRPTPQPFNVAALAAAGTLTTRGDAGWQR